MVMVWNLNQDATVSLAKIKEITINDFYCPECPGQVVVQGWYNKDNSFKFGLFPNIDEARAFVEKITKRTKTAWNKYRTAMVFLSKIKECCISPVNEKNFRIYGWFNQYNHFNFGEDFESMEECRKFINDMN